MTLRPQNVSQSVRLKHPDGLESASRRPLRGIRAHSATSPKRRSRCWSRRPAARGGSRPPPVEEGITSRFFCGRQPCRLIAPLSSEGMPFLTVGFADNRTFCPAVAKTCDYPQAAGAAKLLSALFPCQTPKNRELCPLCGLVCAKNRLFCPQMAKTGDSSHRQPAARPSHRQLAERLCSPAVVCNRAAPMSLLVKLSCAA